MMSMIHGVDDGRSSVAVQAGDSGRCRAFTEAPGKRALPALAKLIMPGIFAMIPGRYCERQPRSLSPL